MIIKRVIWSGRWGCSGRTRAPALFLGCWIWNVVRRINWKIRLKVNKGVRFSWKVTRVWPVGGAVELGGVLGSLVLHQRETTVKCGPGACESFQHVTHSPQWPLVEMRQVCCLPRALW